MMSVTNKSRVLALVLAIAMILSLVPVMAAAESGKDSMGYAVITYPESDDATRSYKISTIFYGADGKKASGDLAVRIYNEDDPLFYYNIIDVKNGAVEFTVSLAGEKEGKYEIEFITANMGASNYAYFYFYNDVAAAKKAFDDDVKAAKSFSDVVLQQKLVTLDGLTVYNKYIVNKENENLSNEYIAKVLKKIEAINPTYTSDAAFIKEVEEATVVALFDEVDKTNKSYFKELIFDKDVLNVISKADKSDDFAEAKELLNEVGKEDINTTVGQIATELSNTTGIYGNFDTIAKTADNLAAAINAILEVEEGGGIKDNITNDDDSFGGGNYKPSKPSNPVIHVSNVFTDLDSSYWWVINPLQTLYINGYVNGRTATTFAPGENITRAEFLKILLLELNMVDANATVAFSDVNASDWFYPYVASGANRGIVKGRSETEFAPNALITREEICIMTMRAVRACNIDLGTAVATGAFTDEADIASYAVEDVHALKAAGIVSGRDTGAFDPKANATRAEAVKILYGVYEKQ